MIYMSLIDDMSRGANTDLIWKALADPTRRELLDALTGEPQTTGQLVELFPDLCRTGVMKHLDVLVEAGLVIVRREGRVRWNKLNPMPIQLIYDRWVSKHVRGVASAMSRLKQVAEGEAEGQKPSQQRPSPRRSSSQKSKTKSRRKSATASRKRK